MIRTTKTLLLLGLLAGATPLLAATPTLADSAPANEARDVRLSDAIELRFDAVMDISTLNESTVTLLGPNGATPVEVMTDESGQELAALPKQDLLPGSRYTLFVDGAKARDGATLPMTTLAFTTQVLHTAAAGSQDGSVRVSAGSAEAIRALNTGCDNTNNVRGYRFCHNEGNLQGGIFTPGLRNAGGHWRTYAPLPKVLNAGDFAAGELPSGMTSLFGAVLRIDDQPLANVTVSIGNQTARTDAKGRFVLKGVPNGHQVLFVDGSSANHGAEEFGQFPVAVDLVANQANAMPHTMFMPRISARDKVSIASPTTADMVITHPAVPGLEIHIPAGAIVRDRNGKVLSEFAIVPMPVDRSPIPVPANFDQYFSMQPGGAHFEGLTKEGAKGLRTIYPNYAAESNAKKSNSVFYYYDAEHNGWDVYGEGHETGDGRQVNVGENWGSQTFMPEGGGTEGGNGKGRSCHAGSPDNMNGDPVDCASGTFLHTATDFTAPVAFTRTYASNDPTKRSFGQGMMNPYEMFLFSPNQGCVSVKYDIGNEIDLVAGDGAVYPFLIPIGTGITFWNSAAVHTGSPSRFYGATLSFTEGATTVQLVDGTQYAFQRVCPSMLTSITDRFGNKTTVNVNAGLINGVTYPSGRSMNFGYDPYKGVINQATDSSGRSIGYTYDASNRMTVATYPDSTTEQYSYDANGNMLTVKDRRGNIMVANQYDANRRVSQQTYADNSTYQFAYTLSGDTVVATDVTDTRGNVKHMTFNVDGYPTSITKAYGTSLAQTTTYQRFFSNFITSKTDALGRVTSWTYDNFGHVLTQTLLSGTPNAATYTYTYTPDSHDVATVTDPLNHTTTYGYTNGCLTSITDPLNHTMVITCNSAGQRASVTDPLNHTMTIGYVGSQVHSIADAANRTTIFNSDALGRDISTLDPMGRESRVTYDSNDRVITSTDPLNQSTAYTYDGNGNLTGVTDPNGGVTHYVYDSRNRKISRTDALNQSESWTYDGQGNVLTYTDRKGQQTTYQYDALNRSSLVTYADSGTVTPTFDAGNRLVQVVDSVSGTITRGYDGLDDMTQEQTPQGTVNYTYDKAGRRTSMMPASQASIAYSYDNANRLTNITQGAQSVFLAYDSANRRTTLNLPNGIVTTYSYDNANELTGITYKTSGGTTLASLGYTYDLAGQRVSQTGGFAADLLPTPTTGTNTFDLNNRQTLWDGFNLYYDVNGDPTTNNGLSPAQTYTFDARHRLTQVQQAGWPVTTFAYDTFGRRTSRTIRGTTTSFLYDGANPVQETQGTTISSILTGLGIDERFARVEAAGTRYFMTDALGSTLALADSSGTVQQTYAYEPFGEVTSTGSSNNPYQYTGRENDGTGLYYYRARYYSPTLKRFISEDPLGFAAGLNEYRYVSDNPANFDDPSGLAGARPRPPTRPTSGGGSEPGGAADPTQIYPGPPPPGDGGGGGWGALFCHIANYIMQFGTGANGLICPPKYVCERASCSGQSPPFDLYAQYPAPSCPFFTPSTAGMSSSDPNDADKKGCMCAFGHWEDY